LMRDIASQVKNAAVLEELGYFLTSMAGKTVSFSKLSRLLAVRGTKISVPTLEKYFYLMKDVFLFFDTRIYSYRIKEQLQYPRKVYAIDTGFVNYFGFKFSEDRGRLMENLVAVELLRRGKKIHYWKNKRGEEVDFVVVKGAKVEELIQVSYDIEDPDTRKRELRALEKAGEELKCKNKTVITWDYEEEGEVRFVPLWKWLLEKSL
ncbi:MAG: ATP-binding protein, partial [Thermoplasmata archaeon]|nr:ATP-binding protein [Thermoplasmata archaeon]